MRRVMITRSWMKGLGKKQRRRTRKSRTRRRTRKEMARMTSTGSCLRGAPGALSLRFDPEVRAESWPQIQFLGLFSLPFFPPTRGKTRIPKT